MQWSKAFLPKDLAASKVLEFVPQKINLGTPEAAKNYVQKKHGSDFRMNDQVQIHTGVDKIEKDTEEEKSERRALEMMAEMQKNAYNEAYQLGLDDGRKKAFEEHFSTIELQLKNFDQMLQTLGRMKEEIVSHNEAHILKLLFHIASRLAMKELKDDEKSIIEVIRSAVSLAQEEEDIRVQLNADQYEFVESLKKQTGREFDFLKKIRLEPNPEVTHGGCVVETNFGEIDSRFEARVNQIWDSMTDAVPKVKSKLSGS